MLRSIDPPSEAAINDPQTCQVDEDRFEEEYAADPYDLPLWDGRMPKLDEGGHHQGYSK
jgi:hypothetical protein